MVNTKIYSRLGKLLSVFAVMITIAPLLQVLVFSGLKKWAIPLSLAVPFVFMGIGYLLQAVVSKIIGYRSNDLEPVADGGKLSYVDKSAIAFPILVCIAEGFGIYFLITGLLKRFEVIYDPYNLYLFLIPIFLAVFSAIGCVFWFIPYHRILPMDMLPLFFSAFTLAFVFSFFVKADTLFLSCCLLIFFPVFMIVNNLRNIEESIRHAKFRMPENGFRSYNFALTVKYILITLLVIAIVFSLFYAVYSNVTIKLNPIEQQRTEWESRDVSSGSSGGNAGNEAFESNAKLSENTGGTTVLQLLSYIIVIGGFLIIIGYWLYKKQLFKKFFEVLKLLWQSFFEFVAAVFELIGQIGLKEQYEVPLTFVDTEEAVGYVDYSAEYGEYKDIQFLSIKEFDEILASKESFEEKYAYAYSTYCALIRIGDNGIKRSDTPRVLTQKLKAQRKANLEKATPFYEEIRYRLAKPTKGPCEEELKALVKLAHSLLRNV